MLPTQHYSPFVELAAVHIVAAVHTPLHFADAAYKFVAVHIGHKVAFAAAAAGIRRQLLQYETQYLT